jgi:5-methylcytosine-specific restriction endonuclease McrA
MDKKRRQPGCTKSAAASKKWRELNRDYLLNYSKQYRSSDKGKAKKAELQRLREKNMNRSHLSKEERAQVDAIYMAARELQRLIEVCPLFNDPLLGKEVHVDHIIPIARGGKHHPSNLQPMLATFNRRKGAKL